MPSASSPPKQKIIWSCQECGHSQPKWTGQCPGCQAWNTLQEEKQLALAPKRFGGTPGSVAASRPVAVTEVNPEPRPRLVTGLREMDRLLGGGAVPGSLTLVGGEPGIGKSTLLLQVAAAMAANGEKVLYVCGEESVEQTSLRARRLGLAQPQLFLLNETQFEAIRQQIEATAPDVLIVDSIQILYRSDLSSAPGSVVQVREIASDLMHLAKGRNMTTFVIGHVTKSGEIAGPRVLEHIVDTVLYFEGEKQHQLRILRVVKNRFGSTDEIAVFQMEGRGLMDVANPSELFLEERVRALSGSVIVPTLEGSRPLLVEVQALVTPSPYSAPSRRSTGLDQNRVALLLAVLEKRVGYSLSSHDVFVAAAGGLRLNEPASDLGLLAAIASSLTNKVIPQDLVIVGEVGLGGEVRAVARLEARLKEAVQLGFKAAIVPQRNLKALSHDLRQQIECVPVGLVEEAIEALWQVAGAI
jgi:DNA repair protein RadA/Sms